MALSEPAGQPEQTGRHAGAAAIGAVRPAPVGLDEAFHPGGRIDRSDLPPPTPDMFAAHRFGQSVQPQMPPAGQHSGRSPDDDAQTGDEGNRKKILIAVGGRRRLRCCWWSAVSSSFHRATRAAARTASASQPTDRGSGRLAADRRCARCPRRRWRPPRPTAPSGFSAAWGRMAGQRPTRGLRPRHRQLEGRRGPTRSGAACDVGDVAGHPGRARRLARRGRQHEGRDRQGVAGRQQSLGWSCRLCCSPGRQRRPPWSGTASSSPAVWAPTAGC